MSTRIILVFFVLLILGGAGAGGLWLVRGRGDPMQRAQAALQAGDLRSAFVELRAASRNRPNDPAPHLALADVMLRLSDPAAAEREFRAAKPLGAEAWAVAMGLAKALAAQGRFKDLLDQVPSQGPRAEVTEQLLLARGGAQLALGDEAAARASLAAAEQARPGMAGAALLRARLALAHDDLAEGEREVDAALQRDAASLDALLMKERLATVRGDAAAALVAADRAVTVAPWSNVARLDRANLLITSGQDAKARTDVDAVLSAQPRDAAALLVSGVLMLRAGRYADASVELQKLNGVSRSLPRVLFFQGMTAASLNQVSSARDLVTRYLAVVPDDPDGLRLLARIEMQAEQPVRALEVLDRIGGAEAADARTLDLRGVAYAATGRLTEAADAFRSAASAAPDDVQILRHLGLSEARTSGLGLSGTLDKLATLATREPAAAEAMVATALSAGELDRAAEGLERLRAQVGETEAVGILTGSLRLARLDTAGAEAVFAEVVKRFPDSVNARLNLARILALAGRAEDGEALLQPLLTSQPGNVRVLSAFVQSALGRQSFQTAIQALEAARKATPGNPGFTATLSDVFVRIGDPNRAVRMLQESRRVADLPPVLLAALWRAQDAAGLVEDTKATFAAAVRATPRDMAVRRAEMEFLVRREDFAGAKAVLRDALRVLPGNAVALSALVALELRTDGLERAMTMAAALRADAANLPQAKVLAGEALMRVGRFTDAAKAFNQEMQAGPSEALALRLADALATGGRDEEAADVLRGWLTRPDAASEEADQVLAKLDIRGKRYQQAQERLERILARRPNDPVALNNLAWVYQVRGDKRALAVAQRAYLRAPTADAADTLGWTMVQQGSAAPALALLRQSSKDRPRDLSIAYHLAVALRDVGKLDEAAGVLSSITAADARFEEVSQARTLLQSIRSGR